MYTPFPPPMPPSKLDLALESGEYFLSEEQKRERAQAAKDAKQEAKAEERKRQREAAFVAPKVCMGQRVLRGGVLGGSRGGRG